MNKPEGFYRQSGVVPFRVQEGRVEVLLITTRKRKLWSIPKGIVETELSAADSAVKEAWEEAGVRGTLLPCRLGFYRQKKWGGVCRIEVFLLRVEMKAGHWPEAWFRQRRWFPLAAATEEVCNRELQGLLRWLPKALVEQGVPESEEVSR